MAAIIFLRKSFEKLLCKDLHYDSIEYNKGGET